MGKYLRKAKITTGDLAVMEVSQASSLGVRTRARTLALQRLQSSTTTAATPPPPSDSDTCYLQLRSRRLEKPPRKASIENPRNESVQNSNPTRSRFRVTPLKSGSVGSVSVTHSNTEDGFGGKDVIRGCETEDDVIDFGVEVSFGENSFVSAPRDRSTRESTPCSVTRDADTMVAPGSTTRLTSLNTTAQRTRPSAQEIEEFFSPAEQREQRRFMEKYNFDVVNDLPLPGPYEWVRVDR